MAIFASQWSEPGGDTDPANPQCPLPADLRIVHEGNIEYWNAREGGGDVSDAEIEWMCQQRPLVLDRAQLALDYGEDAEKILAKMREFSLSESVAGALAWPGLGSRWERFFIWLEQLPESQRPDDARAALAGFARALGRVRTFRALALDDEGLRRIFQEDEIFPSGRLRSGVDAAQLRRVVAEHGVAKVAVVRLYISNMPKIGGLDPSISLHDDWQTTSIIASGYAGYSKKVHLFELSVPAVESLGWTLQEVAHRAPVFLGADYKDHDPWFKFPSPVVPEGTWFDSTLQRTERYGLFSVPHLRNRLRRLYVFDSREQLRSAVAPFVNAMQRRYDVDRGQ